MARTRRFAARKASTSSTTPTHETQNVHPTESLENVIQGVEQQPHEMEGQQAQVSGDSQQQNERPPSYKAKRVCNKYWLVDVIDDQGRTTEEKLRVRDVLVLAEHKKVVVLWSEENQPVADGGSLLNGFLGHLACNTNVFPIYFDRWPSVLPSYKTTAWETIQKKFQLHHDDHYEYCMANMGKKWKDNRWRLCSYYYNKNASFDQNLENYPEGPIISRDGGNIF
ncbi:uncharacterized protein LOC133285666 [Gastrolobium bilobum]|uniref:uncharacterized protein LOC133285666 n=1 Tax=Gastrolobium bilobum TaxID=150636 RepID=UPI002AB204EF|nr:uncharacterized protein LOC133285666 [Gastrolobium bilobum]